MSFFRPIRILVFGFTMLIPAAARTVEPQEKAETVCDLIQKVQKDKLALNYDEQHGYLQALLKHLNVPVSSQTLVFSKSSLQLSQIAPDAPRAVYFNDDVYIGWVNHGQFIEIAEVDPEKGPV